jgi:hypothetical protein
MFQGMKMISKAWGYENISYAAIGMDHSNAIKLAVMTEAPDAHIVDCSIHVDRGFKKNSIRLLKKEHYETFRGHLRMMKSITDEDLFRLFTTCVMADWRKKKEFPFAEWFEEVYLNTNWRDGCFYAGAARSPGMPNHNQCDEAMNRSLKRVMKKKASVEHFIEVSLPDMLQHLRLHYSFRSINRGPIDQLQRLRDGHIHRDVLEKAQTLILASQKNLPGSYIGRGPNRQKVWYVNSSGFMYQEYSDTNAVTKVRTDNFKKHEHGLTITEFEARYLSLHVVKRINMTVNERDTYRLVCTCAGFWDNNTLCAHIVAVYHVLNAINIFSMLQKLMAVRKRGRPTNRELALERDKDIDPLSIRPQDWRGADVYDPHLGHGMVFSWRLIPESHGGAAWNARFPNSPDGQGHEVEFYLEPFKSVLEGYRAYRNRCVHVDQECA